MKIIIENMHDWFSWLSSVFIPLIIAGITTVVNVWLVNKNTNKQIKNQNKETYRPRLKLKKVEQCVSNLNVVNYIKSNDYIEKMSEKLKFRCKFNITLENIGYGFAHDVKFFNLISGKRCIKRQTHDSRESKKGFSTIDINKNGKDDIIFHTDFYFDQNKEEWFPTMDKCYILVVYNDLNQNSYTMLIDIQLINVLKEEKHLKEFPMGKAVFNYSCVQENTDEFNWYMEQGYLENYNKIMENIKQGSDINV